MNTLPKDPIILLSYVNTQLRDNYNSLEEMCQALDTDYISGKKPALSDGFR